jgi:hypothetical protein
MQPFKGMQMATQTSTPAAKTPKAPKEPKVQKPLLDRIDEQIRKQVLAGKITTDELTGFQARITKYLSALEALK